MRTDHVISTPTSSPIVSTIPIFFFNFITIFHVKIQNLPYLAIFSIHSSHAFQYHSVLVHSGDCSSVSTGISIFRNFGQWIPLEWYRNLQDLLESSRNQWGIDKSSAHMADNSPPPMNVECSRTTTSPLLPPYSLPSLPLHLSLPLPSPSISPFPSLPPSLLPSPPPFINPLSSLPSSSLPSPPSPPSLSTTPSPHHSLQYTV